MLRAKQPLGLTLPMGSGDRFVAGAPRDIPQLSPRRRRGFVLISDKMGQRRIDAVCVDASWGIWYVNVM